MLTHTEILAWLHESDPARLEQLYAQADQARRESVGDEVHLRGLIEISNHCRRRCQYCGLNAGNESLGRYRMSAAEIMQCVSQAVRFGYGTVVLQSGEDLSLEAPWIAEVIARIKTNTDLAVTLSLGERGDDEFQLWRQAGADRYLLRFETSNPRLYREIHPDMPKQTSDRVRILRRLRQLGYEIGSGVMIGVPGQKYDDLAADIELFAELDLDMIGVGPYIPHPRTSLGRQYSLAKTPGQPPNNEEMTYKMIALARLACPGANIPSTTALATINRHDGRELGLSRGANVVMPILTPPRYRAMYDIYPAKACIDESAEDCRSCLRGRIAKIGRSVGSGRGDSRRNAKIETENSETQDQKTDGTDLSVRISP